jgi:hypothetical protein
MLKNYLLVPLGAMTLKCKTKREALPLPFDSTRQFRNTAELP